MRGGHEDNAVDEDHRQRPKPCAKTLSLASGADTSCGRARLRMARSSAELAGALLRSTSATARISAT